MLGPVGLLLVAIVVEVASTSALPRTDGFRHPGWSLAVIAGYGVSVVLLAIVVRHIPVSVAYAVWSGLGTAAVGVIGIVVLGEPLTPLKAAAIGMIVAGVIILNLDGAH